MYYLYILYTKTLQEVTTGFLNMCFLRGYYKRPLRFLGNVPFKKISGDLLESVLLCVWCPPVHFPQMWGTYNEEQWILERSHTRVWFTFLTFCPSEIEHSLCHLFVLELEQEVHPARLMRQQQKLCCSSSLEEGLPTLDYQLVSWRNQRTQVYALYRWSTVYPKPKGLDIIASRFTRPTLSSSR